MKEHPEDKPKHSENTDTDDIMAALMRAAKRGHKIAYQTGTKVVIMRDGKVVEIDPDPEMYGDI